MCIKSVYCTSVHKTGCCLWNITKECTGTEHYQSQAVCKLFSHYFGDCASVHSTVHVHSVYILELVP